MKNHRVLPEVGASTLLRIILNRPSSKRIINKIESKFSCRPPHFSKLKKISTQIHASEGRIPLTFYYTLVQRAQLASMLESDFPYRIAGMVHVENSLERHADIDDLKEVEVINTYWPVEDNGRLYIDFDTRFLVEDNEHIYCRSRYFIRRLAASSKHDGLPKTENWTTIGNWALTKNSGRSYARASGDWNPIHLWGWSAKLLGMKQPIIHGMHSVGNAASLIEKHERISLKLISAKFIQPIALGQKIELQLNPIDREYRVCVENRPCVVGSYN